jgi:hypothetical protein
MNIAINSSRITPSEIYDIEISIISEQELNSKKSVIFIPSENEIDSSYIQFSAQESLINKLEHNLRIVLQVDSLFLVSDDPFEASINARQFSAVRFHTIPISHAASFFDALKSVQENGVRVLISEKTLNFVLPKIVGKSIFDAEKSEKYKTEILTHEGYIQKVQETKDPEGCVSIAYYYRNKKGITNVEKAISWIKKAQFYERERPLEELIDVRAFFDPIVRVNSTWLFEQDDNEVSDAIARFSKVSHLRFSEMIQYTDEFSERLLAFLKTSVNIEKITFDAPSFNKSTQNTLLNNFTKVVNSLRYNSSIKECNFSHHKIKDEQVKTLVEALDANAQSPIESLNFFDCQMTNHGVRMLSSLIDHKPTLTNVNVKYNDQVEPKIEIYLYRKLVKKLRNQLTSSNETRDEEKESVVYEKDDTYEIESEEESVVYEKNDTYEIESEDEGVVYEDDDDSIDSEIEDETFVYGRGDDSVDSEIED